MERKEMIRLLESHSGTKAKYLGVPSCNYEIEIHNEKYIISKDGTMKDEAGIEVELETLLNTRHEDETVEPTEAAEPIVIEVTVSMEGHTGITLKNLVNITYSKQALIKKSLGAESDIVEDDFCKSINEAKIETIEEFKAAINNRNCPGFGFDFNNSTVTFKFLEGEASAEKLQAYTQLVSLLNQNAKTLKHASAKSKDTDNDKFTFRVFLIRLGMVGDEYKAARKVLLENLEGNSAFRSGKKPEKSTAIDAE